MKICKRCNTAITESDFRKVAQVTSVAPQVPTSEWFEHNECPKTLYSIYTETEGSYFSQKSASLEQRFKDWLLRQSIGATWNSAQGKRPDYDFTTPPIGLSRPTYEVKARRSIYSPTDPLFLEITNKNGSESGYFTRMINSEKNGGFLPKYFVQATETGDERGFIPMIWNTLTFLSDCRTFLKKYCNVEQRDLIIHPNTVDALSTVQNTVNRVFQDRHAREYITRAGRDFKTAAVGFKMPIEPYLKQHILDTDIVSFCKKLSEPLK